MRILGLDYGKKRIGIAISDENQKYAFPYLTLENKGKNFVFAKIKMITETEKVEKIVMGFPLTLKGKTKEAAQDVQNFASRLKKFLNLPIILEDERLTSQLAGRLLKENPQKKAKQKSTVDQQAAVIILQGYLDKNSR